MSSNSSPAGETHPPVTERGMLIVVTSPSGGGKGTLIHRALKTVPNLRYSVSFTTRDPRAGELEGIHYHFVTQQKFSEMVEAGEFLEWAVVHGNSYGTSSYQVAREISEGHDLILEIDVQGATSVRKLVADAVTIFILPPSFQVLRERLTNRGSEDADDLALRLKNARTEVARFAEFDYIVVNDDADRAAAQLAAIIYAERARCSRQERAAQQVLATFETPERASDTSST